MFELLTEIVSNERLTDDTWLMALRSPEIANAARPGQFVMVRIGSGVDPFLRRPFSISGVEQGCFMLLYRVVGKATVLMTGLKDGERLWVLGPLGKGFAAPEKHIRRIAVGGGIGIAPLVFLCRFFKETDVTLLTGFRSAKDVLPAHRMVGINSDLLVATDDGTKGHHGPVTDLLEEFIQKNPSKVAIYACGPKPMLRKVAERALALRIHCQVSLEAHMACGLGACQGCAVKGSARSGGTYFHVCKEGPVFEAEEIDWEMI
jgi:dihydroorotate dehydrogenase electron transfer subunit